MPAYYNENDAFCVAWLKALIADGLIAPGDVDDRSIEAVQPEDLRGYDQGHFFAGIGGWSYALRLADWPDDRFAWTGSCPCQPFSVAGKGGGPADPRHLWPAWFRLIAECRPPVLFAEQVGGPAGLAWLDAVYADLEGIGYAIGAVDLPAASVGAPHRRQRLWVVADTDEGRSGWDTRAVPCAESGTRGEVRRVADGAESGRGAGGVADALPAGRPERRTGAGHGSSASSSDGVVAKSEGEQYDRGRDAWRGRREPPDDGGLGHPDPPRSQGRRLGRDSTGERPARAAGVASGLAHPGGPRCRKQYPLLHPREPRPDRAEAAGSGASDFWTDCVWLPCRDGRWRPTQPGLQPLAHGIPHRVGTLRGAGNSIVAPLAAEFIRAYRETCDESLHGMQAVETIDGVLPR